MAGLGFGHTESAGAAANRAFKAQLNKVYGWYTGGFIAFILILAVLEQMGLPRQLDRFHLPARHGRRCMPASAS